jgi:hypothetical protein
LTAVVSVEFTNVEVTAVGSENVERPLTRGKANRRGAGEIRVKVINIQ